MAAHLLQGSNKGDIYESPQSGGTASIFPCALFGVKASLSSWHNHFSHPYAKILQQIVKSSFLPMSCSITSNFNYDSYHCNKS